MDNKTWLNDATILIDEAICTTDTTYDIKVSYSQIVTNDYGAAFNHCGMVFNDTNSKFSNFESIGSLLTGKTSANFLCTNFLLAKGGIASVKGFSNYQSIPTQYINFYYNSAISALEIYILTGNGNDVGGGVTSSFVSQKIGYILSIQLIVFHKGL